MQISISSVADAAPKSLAALDRMVKLQKRGERTTLLLKPKAVRTSAGDLDKQFKVYFANKNSTINYASKGLVYIKALLSGLNKYNGWSNIVTKTKADIDTHIAMRVTETTQGQFIPAIGDATITVDSQAKRVYYSFAPFVVHINTPYEYLKDHADILEMLFSQVRIGNNATKVSSDKYERAANAQITMESKGFIPLQTLEKHKIPMSVMGNTLPEGVRPSSKEYPKEISALTEIEVTLVSATTDIFGDQKMVDLKGREVNLQFNINLRLAFPLAYAYWSTYATSANNLSIPNFFNLISMQVIGAAGGSRADTSVDRLIPMQTSMDILQERVTKLNLKQQPRINRNRFTILSTGEVWYIPPDGDLKQYDSLIKQSYDPETRKVTPLNKIPEIKDMFLIADWVHNIAVYTNSSGVVNTLSLIGAMPFEDRFVWRYFRQQSFARAFGLELDTFVPIAVEMMNKLNVNIEDIVNKIQGNVSENEVSIVSSFGMTSIFNMFFQLPGIYDSTYAELFDVNSTIWTESLTDNEKMVVLVFRVICEVIYKGMFKVHSKSALATLMKFALPFYVFGIAGQPKNVIRYKEVFDKNVDLNKKDPSNYLTAMTTTIDLPNLPGMTSGLLPHQAASYLTSLHKSPKLVSIDISAGGGKTGTMLIDMANLLSTGAIKRPIILCPAKLVSEWVSETNKWSQGKLNPYPLTAGSVKKLSKYLGYDRTKLLTVIREAPPNTVFIASYSFLKVADPFGDTTASKMQYGATVVNFYPNTQFIKQGGFDYCVTGDTKVSTPTGFVPIKKFISANHALNRLVPYDGNLKVITPEGIKEVSHTLKRKVEAFRVTTNMGYFVKGSGNHPIQVLTPELDLVMKEIDDCQIGDFVCVGNKQHKFNPKNSSLNYQPTAIYNAKTRYPSSFTPSLAKFLGYFISEGNYTDYRVEFTNNDIDLISDFAKLTYQLFGIKPEIDSYTRNNQTTSRVRINSRDVIGFLQYLGVKTGSQNKRVPIKLFTSSKESATEFMRAYYEGDGGCNSGSSITATSKSKKLLEDIQQMLLMFNITSYLSKAKDARWGKLINIYYLNINKNNSYLFMRKIGFISAEKTSQGQQFFVDNLSMVKNYHGNIPFVAKFRQDVISKYTTSKNRSRLLCRDGIIRQLPIFQTTTKTYNANNIKPYLDNLKAVCLDSYNKVVKVLSLNVCFDQIKTIKSIGEKFVYDLTIPGSHRFFANGLLVSNCAMDESHKLKNLSTQISKATRSVIGDMDYRRIASGTILFNTVQDLEGQTALLNPGILTDMKMAILENAETDSTGKVTSVDPRMADVISDQMTPYVSRLVYRRRDWGYLLPRINFSWMQCDMTPNLQEYYNKKIDEKIEELMKDPKVAKILESEDQDKIDKIMSSLDASFQKMEILINTPESDEVFANLNTTEPADLVPPKSALVNQIIAAHFSGGTVTDVTGRSSSFVKTSAKIIIFGYNRDVSKGIYKYLPSNYKAMAVHYSAGNKDAILKFRDDVNVKILIADETSIREGLNLQMASQIVRLQSLWTPGAQEQAMSRILRADIDNVYGRTELYITQIMCRNSMDIAKTARNISKQVSNLGVSEGDRPDWKRFIKGTKIPELPQIKMNLKLLRNKGNVESVGDYFAAYRDITQWDYNESRTITEGLVNAVANKLGIQPQDVTISVLRDQSRTQFKSSTVLAGSKAIWTPIVPNATILDKFGLGLQPLAIVKPGTEVDDEDDSDPDNVEIEDNVTYAIGDMVVTEFGLGFIRNFRTGRTGSINEGKNTSVNVEIPGFHKYYAGKDYINLSLLEVFKPTNDDVAIPLEKRLVKLEERGQGILFIKDGIAGIDTASIMSKTSPSNIKTLKPKDMTRPALNLPKHPGANPANPIDTDFDINDLIPADRIKSKPVTVIPTDQGPVKLPNPKDSKGPPPTTRVIKTPDDDVVRKIKPGVIPTPGNLDDKNRIKILQDFQKDPNKLFHYQKQTDTTSVVIDLAVVNGEISMCTYPGEENFPLLQEATPNVWNKLGPMVFIKVKTLSGAKNLAAKLENEFSLLDGMSDRLIKLAKSMQSKTRPQVEQNQKMDFSTLRNFVLINHQKSKLDDGVKAYPTVYDGNLYLIVPYSTQTKNCNKLLKWSISGCDRPKLNRLVSGYSFYRNRNQALKALDKIATRLHIVNYVEVRDMLRNDPMFQNFVGR